MDGVRRHQLAIDVQPLLIREIRTACANKKISVDGRDGMTIGTVHALQGAERPVVIFSPVYSKHADGGFIDASPSMLNITVSRAKDSCLVFGDMDVLSTAAPGSPRAILADFLFRSTTNALEFDAEPRDDLQEVSGKLQMLRDATEHDAFGPVFATCYRLGRVKPNET